MINQSRLTTMGMGAARSTKCLLIVARGSWAA